MFNQKARKAEIHLTYHCDLDCPGCNRACFHKRDVPPSMTEERFCDILLQIEELGFNKELVIIGGEPTLHPQCVDFMRIAKERGFKQTIWSNAYSDRAKVVLDEIRKDGLGNISEGTHKFNGAVAGFHNPYIFCSPHDMGTFRAPCKWGIDSGSCGYAADENGFVPCPIGTIIAHYTAPRTLAYSLSYLTDWDYMENVYKDLCKHCGSFFQLDINWDQADKSDIQEVNNTKMTETWRTIFA